MGDRVIDSYYIDPPKKLPKINMGYMNGYISHPGLNGYKLSHPYINMYPQYYINSRMGYSHGFQWLFDLAKLGSRWVRWVGITIRSLRRAQKKSCLIILIIHNST